MVRKRILFYLEPVTYADSPLRLGGWWSFCSAFAARSISAMTSAVAASPSICALGSPYFSEIHPIDQIELLRISRFDRSAYSRDLCFGTSYKNFALLEELERLKAAFAPDIVMSVTDNRYLKKVFGPGNVFFMELGPLPRMGMHTAIYFDPYGHQIDSALDWFARNRWDHPKLGEFAELWHHKWINPICEVAQAKGIPSWFDAMTARFGLSSLLVALQPRDWITYEGIGPLLDPISLLRSLACDLGNDRMILPQWHGSDTPPSEALITELEANQPNIAVPPEHLRVAQSEMFLPLVEGVATISSNVAAIGAILGKKLIPLGKSKFHEIALQAKHNDQRIDILAFLSSRYCLRLDDTLNIEGFFADHIRILHRNPTYLFDPTGVSPNELERFFT